MLTLGELFTYLSPETEFQLEAKGNLKDCQAAFNFDRLNHKKRFNTVQDTDEELHPCEVKEIHHEDGVLWIIIGR